MKRIILYVMMVLVCMSGVWGLNLTSTNATGFLWGDFTQIKDAIQDGSDNITTLNLTVVGDLTVSKTCNITGVMSAATLNTGQGANELYDMNQNVLTSSTVTFGKATVSNNFTVGTDSLHVDEVLDNVCVGCTNPRALSDVASRNLDVQGAVFIGSAGAVNAVIAGGDSISVNIDYDDTTKVSDNVGFIVRKDSASFSSGVELFRVKEDGRLNLLNFTADGNDPVCWDGSGASLITDCSSSRDYKKDIVDFDIDIASYKALRAREFRWKTTDVPDAGLIAEETDETNPFLVRYREGVPKSVKYDVLAVANLEMIQYLMEELCSKDDTYGFCAPKENKDDKYDKENYRRLDEWQEELDKLSGNTSEIDDFKDVDFIEGVTNMVDKIMTDNSYKCYSTGIVRECHGGISSTGYTCYPNALDRKDPQRCGDSTNKGAWVKAEEVI